MSSPKRITPTLKQTWCASSILIGIIGMGMMLGHTSCLLSALLAPDSEIKIDVHTTSWLASSMGPAVLVGIVISCTLMDRYGRRLANLLSLLPGAIGWIMIYLAQSYSVLFIGRTLTGIAAGATSAVGAIVIGEYTSPQNRGMFLNLKTTAFMVGSAIIHILGNYMHWRTLTIVALIPHIIAFLMTCTWPESPTWLATRKRFDECEKVFFWLRGINEKPAQEVSELIAAQKERMSQTKTKISFAGKIGEFFRKFTKKDFLKPLLVTMISFLVMEATGRHYFPTYALQIMSDVINTDTLPYYYTLCVDLIIIVGSLISSVLIRLLKRRTLFFGSGIGSLILLVCLCIYSFLISRNIVSKDYPWIITSIFIVYFFVTSLGCAPIPIALQGELFPVAHRESATTVLAVFVSLSLMGVLKVTPYLLVATKVYGTFAFFGIVMAISLLILYFILPETKDRSLQEIENYYHHGKFKNEDEEKFIAQVKMTTNEHH